MSEKATASVAVEFGKVRLILHEEGQGTATVILDPQEAMRMAALLAKASEVVTQEFSSDDYQRGYDKGYNDAMDEAN